MEKKTYVAIGSGATLVGILAILLSLGLSITSDGDHSCAGTAQDPCISYINVSNPTFTDVILSGNNISVAFSRDVVSSYQLYELYGTAWSPIDFSRSFAMQFPSHSTTQLKLVGYKTNPQENVEWTLSAGSLVLDPAWNNSGNYTSNSPDLEPNVTVSNSILFCDIYVDISAYNNATNYTNGTNYTTAFYYFKNGQLQSNYTNTVQRNTTPSIVYSAINVTELLVQNDTWVCHVRVYTNSPTNTTNTSANLTMSPVLISPTRTIINAPPTMSVFSPVNNSILYASKDYPPQLTWNIADTDADTVNFTIYAGNTVANMSPIYNSSQSPGAGNFTWNAIATLNGTYYWNMSFTDNQVNHTTWKNTTQFNLSFYNWTVQYSPGVNSFIIQPNASNGTFYPKNQSSSYGTFNISNFGAVPINVYANLSVGLPRFIDLIFYAASAGSSYQNQSNASFYQGNWNDTVSATDANFNTASYNKNNQNGTAYLYTNYTKPANSAGASWRVKVGINGSNAWNSTADYLLPDACWRDQPTKISLRISHYVNSTSSIDVGNGSDGTVVFTIASKSYGNLAAGTDYAVSGNTLYLNLNRKYNFQNFTLGAGTIMQIQSQAGAALEIDVNGTSNIQGTVDVSNAVTYGVTSASYNFGPRTLLSPSVAAGGASGSGEAAQFGFGGGGDGAGEQFDCSVGFSAINGTGAKGNYSSGTGGNGGAAYAQSGFYFGGCNNIQGPQTTSGSNGTEGSAGGGGTGVARVVSGICGTSCSVRSYGNGGNGGQGWDSTGRGGDGEVGYVFGSYFCCDGYGCHDYTSTSYNTCGWGGGGGGAGGRSGKPGAHVVLKVRDALMNGTVNTSGTVGGAGGDGGTSVYRSGSTQSHGVATGIAGFGGGGGGGGNAGNLYVYYLTGTVNLTFIGVGGAGGVGGRQYNASSGLSPQSGVNGTIGTNGTMTVIRMEDIHLSCDSGVGNWTDLTTFSDINLLLYDQAISWQFDATMVKAQTTEKAYNITSFAPKYQNYSIVVKNTNLGFQKNATTREYYCGTNAQFLGQYPSTLSNEYCGMNNVSNFDQSNVTFFIPIYKYANVSSALMNYVLNLTNSSSRMSVNLYNSNYFVASGVSSGSGVFNFTSTLQTFLSTCTESTNSSDPAHTCLFPVNIDRSNYTRYKLSNMSIVVPAIKGSTTKTFVSTVATNSSTYIFARSVYNNSALGAAYNISFSAE